MFALRIVIAIVLGIVSFAVIVGNWELALAGAFRGRRGSMVPLIGGASGAIAIAVAPWRFQPWWPVPLLLDLGGAPMLGFALVAGWRRWRAH